MKHKLVVISCAVSVVVLVALAAGVWQKEQVIAGYSRANAYATEQARKQVVKHNYELANDDCKKGQSAYDAQTAAYHKANPVRPTCDLQIVE